jgi:hypothetical protein
VRDRWGATGGGVGPMKGNVKASAVVLLGCLLLGQAAHAQALEPSAEELESARADFSEATQLEARADWQGASAKLRSALAIKETPGLRYHLAHCEEQLGALLQASRDYERASELIRDGAPAPDVEPLLPLAQRRLDSRLAKLELVVPPGTSAVAELDGHPLPPSAIGAAVKVDPGVHRVLVRAPGHRDYRAELSFARGERRMVKVFFGPESPIAPDTPRGDAGPPAPRGARTTAPVVPPPVAPADSTNPREGGGLGARELVMIGEGALALGGLGVGIGFAFARHRASQRVDLAQLEVDAMSASDPSACLTPASSPPCVTLARAIDDHQRAATVEAVGFIGAGVASGLLVATWLWWPAAHDGLKIAVHPRASGALVLAGGGF